MNIEKSTAEQDEALHEKVPVAVQEWVDDPRVPAIKRKVDIRICLVLGALYVINQIDRINLGTARVAGMNASLGLIGNQYNTIVIVFFATYILVQPFATVTCRKMGPRIFITSLVVGWGAVTLGIGFAQGWETLVALRVLLGLIEGGFFPSALFLLSMWYVRAEVAKRNAVLYLCGTIASGFGGILAYGFSRMDGISGLDGWRWIFIMEGIITFVLAAVGYIFIIDFPEEAKNSWRFLTPEESEIMIERVDNDRRDAHVTPFSLSDYLRQGLDWKIWFYAANFGFSGLVTYAVAYFLPTILSENLGFSTVASLCLPAPCYVFATIMGYTEAWVSDKYNIRGPIIVLNAVLEIIGIALLGYAGNPWVRYFGAYLIVGGCSSNVPASTTYQGINIVGQWRRAFCNATLVAAGGVGGIIGTITFRTQDALEYIPGLATCFAAAGLTIVSVFITSTHHFFQNRRQAQGEIVIEGVEGFRYTL